MELYKKYRPKKLERMVGQSGSVKVLTTYIKSKKVPHALLFSGPSGCGKTTLARILRKELKCGKYDFTEKNCRKIEEIRQIRSQMNQAPISGKTRIWLLDEAHQLTSDAQNEFLKMLEDTPRHVYFMLATTDPQKLKRTIRNRCTEIVVRSLVKKSMYKLLERVCNKEETSIPKEVLNEIIEWSEGSARKALVLLDQIIELDDEEAMLEAIKVTTAEIQSIAICRALFNMRTNWSDMAKILKETTNEDSERIRLGVLGYATKVILGGGKNTSEAYIIIDAFRDNFYDCKFAGLAAACWEVLKR